MHGRPVVPQHEVACPPFETDLKAVLCAVRIEFGEQRIALRLVHADDGLDARRDAGKDVDALAPGFGMGADDGMHDLGQFLPLLLRHQRSEEHTSELQSLMSISYAVFCVKKKKSTTTLSCKKQEQT